MKNYKSATEWITEYFICGYGRCGKCLNIIWYNFRFLILDFSCWSKRFGIYLDQYTRFRGTKIMNICEHYFPYISGIFMVVSKFSSSFLKRGHGLYKQYPLRLFWNEGNLYIQIGHFLCHHLLVGFSEFSTRKRCL